MRDAYILDLHVDAGVPASLDDQLASFVSGFRTVHDRVFDQETPLTWMAVASGSGRLARSIGLLSGYSASMLARDVASGSGLSAVAAAARAVTSGFESVAAGVALGASVSEHLWPTALNARFTKVDVLRTQLLALARAELTPTDIQDVTEARRARRSEAGDSLVALEAAGELPHAPDGPGLGVVLMAGHSEIREHQWRTRARITSVVEAGVDPALGPAAGAKAAEQALHRLHLRADELDLIQVDARLAATPSVVAKALRVSEDRVNLLGDALTAGGGGGASGFADLDRLLRGLEDTDRRFGLLVGLEPLGGATAVVVDRQFYL